MKNTRKQISSVTRLALTLVMLDLVQASQLAPKPILQDTTVSTTSATSGLADNNSHAVIVNSTLLQNNISFPNEKNFISSVTSNISNSFKSVLVSKKLKNQKLKKSQKKNDFQFFLHF